MFVSFAINVIASFAHLVRLDARVLADDTRSTARCVKQDTVETTHDLGELPSVIRTHGDILASQTVDVRRQTLRSSLVQLVREDDTRVLHERCHVCGLASRSTSHVEHALAGLRSERNDGEERRGSLEHVVTRKVLWGSTDWYATLEDLQTNVRPLADGLEVHTAVDQSLREVPSASAQGVCSDSNWTGDFVGFEEFNGLVKRRCQKLCQLQALSSLTSDTGKSWNNFSARKSL